MESPKHENERFASPTSSTDGQEQTWKKLLQAEQEKGKGPDRPWNDWKASEEQPFDKPWVKWGIEFGIDNYRGIGGS